MTENSNSYLATEKIGKLILKFSIPCILSMLVSSLYNIVDQMFIGRGIGYLANGATNVVFPTTVIALAIALLIGDGCAAYLSICQGRKDTENGHKSVGNAVFALIFIGIIITVLYAIFKEQILKIFAATENNIDYAREYYDYIIIGIPFFMFGCGMSSVIRADGSPRFAMISTLVGCIINVICDPIAIFVLNWGMKGAALATIFGQIVTAVMSIVYLFKMKSVKLHLKSLVPSLDVLRHILPLGISSFLTQMSIVIIMAVCNNVLIKYGAMSKYGADIPLTVIGIVSKVNQIVIAFVVGIAAGSQPIVGYNYGAKKFDRVKKIYKTMMMAEVVVGIISTIVFELFPLQITNLFGAQDGLYNEFAVKAFRIYMSTIILCCVIKSTSIFLQSIGKPVMSMSLSLMRDFVLSIPLQLILPIFMGIFGTIWCIPIIDVSTFIVLVIMMRIVYKELSNPQAQVKAE